MAFLNKVDFIERILRPKELKGGWKTSLQVARPQVAPEAEAGPIYTSAAGMDCSISLVCVSMPHNVKS